MDRRARPVRPLPAAVETTPPPNPLPEAGRGEQSFSPLPCQGRGAGRLGSSQPLHPKGGRRDNSSPLAPWGRGVGGEGVSLPRPSGTPEPPVLEAPPRARLPLVAGLLRRPRPGAAAEGGQAHGGLRPPDA